MAPQWPTLSRSHFARPSEPSTDDSAYASRASPGGLYVAAVSAACQHALHTRRSQSLSAREDALDQGRGSVFSGSNQGLSPLSKGSRLNCSLTNRVWRPDQGRDGPSSPFVPAETLTCCDGGGGADMTVGRSDSELGRAAADRLVHDWPELHDLDERVSPRFAEAAIARLAELIEAQPALFQASRRGSERGAESLSARPFQGVLESLQNGDDLGATELRVGLRKQRSHRELLVVHDGAPMSLLHVGAMVLPWVSTKTDDPALSGRFGIGQKTLRALGGPIEVHCRPYHFRMDETPLVVAPAPSIAGFHDAARRETLLVVPLHGQIDTDALQQFIAELGTQSLVFLRSIRRLTFTDLASGRTIEHRLRERVQSIVSLQIRGRGVDAERLELADSSRGQRYTRYIVEFPLKGGDRRHNKATGPTTTLGVSLPARPERGLLYDRLPLPVPCALPVGLNAQFDPDTARSTLHENLWNARRFAELGDLLAAAALDSFERKPSNGWTAVPLSQDVPDGIGAWLRQRYETDVIAGAQQRLRRELCLVRDGEARSLDKVVFEQEGLDRVLTTIDQETLAPDFAAVVPDDRDRAGRWRSILEELGRSRSIGVEEAFRLLEADDEEVGPRDPRWFIDFARAAVDGEVFEEFCEYAGVLLVNGERIAPPGRDEPRSLVVREEPGRLAARLELALPVHHVYLGADAGARKVRAKLEELKFLVEAYESDDEALALLARGSRDAVQLDDRDLITLRDAFERLSDDDQRALGPRIGRAIELRGFHYDADGKREDYWISPDKSYLPTQIDRETDSFARAAGKTPGLAWMSPDYARLLKRSDRRELGPQRFLVRLGAQTFPRLVPPPNERQRYSRDRRRTSEVLTWQAPDIQTTELRALSQQTRHLIGDHWSPDLDAVIGSIQDERPGKQRRRRAAALLGLLARGWERHFADRVSAKAAWGYDGYWHVEGEVIATWLARAATEVWLPSATGSLHAPADLHLPTEENRLTVGDRKGSYLMSVDDYTLRSPALIALRVRRGPSASSVVKRLEELRDEGTRLARKADLEAKTAYRLLALACPAGDGRARRPVDDMTIAALRTRFAGPRGTRGLILANGQWYAPRQIFNGPPIFGRWRPFVPQSPYLETLWRTLAVPYPDVRDCLDVLRELASTHPTTEDVPVVIETMAAVARQLDGVSPQLRATLKSLPLWTGREWRTARPIYAIDDEAVASAVADQAPVWQPGFALHGMNALLNALDLTYLAPDDFRPVAAAGYGAAEGEEWRPRFALAVEHLRTELARRDQELYKTLSTSWEELAGTTLVLDDELEVAATVTGRRRLVAPARAHLVREPLTLFVRSVEDVGSAEAGGQAIASLFSGHRHTVAWAWTTMWQWAAAGETAGRIVLSTDRERNDEEDDRLGKLQTQAEIRRRGKKTTPGASGGSRANGSKRVQVRKLKDLARRKPTTGEVVNKGAARGGVIIPKRRANVASPGSGSDTSGGSGGGDRSRPSTVLPPMSEREQLAYDAVVLALALGEGEVADLRNRRGVGADAIDELRQCFEIKMSSGAEIPNEITLTPNEVERARTDPDFFLAVVAGLEEAAGELRVRFIFDPLGRLPLRLRSDLTFGGVRDAEALEYTFPASAVGSETKIP
jgi:hypothetical protein